MVLAGLIAAPTEPPRCWESKCSFSFFTSTFFSDDTDSVGTRVRHSQQKAWQRPLCVPVITYSMSCAAMELLSRASHLPRSPGKTHWSTSWTLPGRGIRIYAWVGSSSAVAPGLTMKHHLQSLTEDISREETIGNFRSHFGLKQDKNDTAWSQPGANCLR